MKAICKLDSEVVVIKAQDDNKAIEANKCTISIPDKLPSCKIEVVCWCNGNVD